jgi:AcrR family transcriptional regulator
MQLDKKPHKRQDVLNAAIALFGRTHDVRKVSLEAIAKEAGVSPTTIYNYFGTRDNLVGEVARKLVQEMLEKSRALISSDLPFPQKVSEIFSVKMNLIGNNREVLLKVLNQAKPVFGDAINLSAIRDLSNEFFDYGKKQGYIDPSFDNQTIAEYFDILRVGIAAKPELATRIELNSPLAKDLTRLIFYGLMKKDVGLFNT